MEAQSDSCHFSSPVNHPIISSGSFGEPRSSHFHSGIDIKPLLGEGKDPLLAIGDGYISRISIQPDGYGSALYIDHPCGHTSVYAHIHNFNLTIQNYIDQVRVATKQSIINQYPPPFALRVKKGEVLGTMGNSGNSFGTHLHFEIRHTKTEVPINPVLFGIGPKDNIAPIIKGLVVYELDRTRKVINQKYYGAKKDKNNLYSIPIDTLKVSWPIVGFGLHVYDMSNGAGNQNGIHQLQYQVNGEEKFSFNIDKVPFDQSIFLHAHMDYDFKKKNKYVHKCFKENLNTLNIYSYPKFGQLLIPNSEVADHINIRAADVFSNSSALNFKLIRTPLKVSIKNDSFRTNIPTSDASVISKFGFNITFSPNTFLHPEMIYFDSTQNGIHVRSTKATIPFFDNYSIQCDLRHMSIISRDKTKITFTTTDSKGRKVNLGAKVEGNNVSTSVNDLGVFQLFEDVSPPKISVIRNDKTNITLMIVDNLKTTRQTRMKYTAHIDDNWVPMEYDEKNNLFIIATKWLKNGKECRIVATDFNNNRASKSIHIR